MEERKAPAGSAESVPEPLPLRRGHVPARDCFARELVLTAFNLDVATPRHAHSSGSLVVRPATAISQ